MPGPVASALLGARWQMALSLGFHIVFAALGVGLPLLLLAAEALALRTGDPAWKTLARRWSKALAVLFAVGAVSGTVLSFEMGLLWPEFIRRFGAAIGLPFTLEAFAFFVEAIFLGVYLYGGNRLSPRAHLLCGIPIAASGAASAAFVTTVNAFMNAPHAVILGPDGAVASLRPFAVMTSRVATAETLHLIVGAYMATGLAVAGVYAVGMLRGRRDALHKKGLALSLALGLGLAPVQVVTGDWAAQVVAHTQTAKLAAMEGQWETRTHAPLRIGGIPDPARETTRFAVEIPGGLSWLAYRSTSAQVRGLLDVPRDARPNARVVHVAFQTMLALGSALLALAAWVGWRAVRKRPLDGRLLLCAIAASGPAAFLAIEAGWTVTECGRQPWIVQGWMRTAEAVTRAPGLWVGLYATIAIYGALGVGAVLVLLHLARLARTGPV